MFLVQDWSHKKGALPNGLVTQGSAPPLAIKGAVQVNRTQADPSRRPNLWLVAIVLVEVVMILQSPMLTQQNLQQFFLVLMGLVGLATGANRLPPDEAGR